MGKAIVDVSCELLRQLLYLPYDTEVVMSLLLCAPTFIKVESPSTITVLDWGSYSDSDSAGQDPDKP